MFAISIAPIFAVLGPTGSGKSELGLALAEAYNGEIINCDSVQVYSDLYVGSAKLPVSERRGIPHYLLDILGIHQELTAGDYSRLARTALTDIRSRGRIPIVVGGTGFYFRALFHGLSPAPPRNRELRLRLGRLRERRPAALHRFVRRFDPSAAQRIHANDHQKLIRAIELILQARQSATITQSTPREGLKGFSVLKLGLYPSRTDLYERLNRRSIWMFENGLLQETRSLLDSGASPNVKPLQSLGYYQAVQVLTGRYSLEQGIAECQTKTRQYSKRQMTWFRSEPGIVWLPGFGWEPQTKQNALDICHEFLQGL